jgi:hypothetical protein
LACGAATVGPPLPVQSCMYRLCHTHTLCPQCTVPHKALQRRGGCLDPNEPSRVRVFGYPTQECSVCQQWLGTFMFLCPDCVSGRLVRHREAREALASALQARRLSAAAALDAALSRAPELAGWDPSGCCSQLSLCPPSVLPAIGAAALGRPAHPRSGSRRGGTSASGYVEGVCACMQSFLDAP